MMPNYFFGGERTQEKQEKDMASVVQGHIIGLWPQNILLIFGAERRKLTLFLVHGRMTLVHDLYHKNLASIVNKLIYGLLTFC